MIKINSFKLNYFWTIEIYLSKENYKLKLKIQKFVLYIFSIKN